MEDRVKRILVTGSRDWTDVAAVALALMQHGPGVVVHGSARGVDVFAHCAADLWSRHGDPERRRWPAPEPHPVPKSEWDRLGKAAGPLRNQRMVDGGADLCLAFPMSSSRGTYDCAARAITAGIPLVWVLPPDLTEQQADEELVTAQGRLGTGG